MPRSWTDQDLQKIARMMRDGKSATEVGNAFRVTRNVIIGKVFRTLWLKAIGWKNFAKLGVRESTIPSIAVAPNRAKTIRGGKPAKPITNPIGTGVKDFRVRPVMKAVAPLVNASAPDPLNLAVMDLQVRSCRWPVSGEKSEALFCGHDTGDILKSYCPHHRALAYQPRQSMKVAA